MESILLAVDLSYQVYRASAANPMLTSRRVFTGGLYGFLMTFGKMVRETKATHVVIAADRKPYVRSATYPEYKQLRKKNADDELLKMFNQSLSLVVECLEVVGLPIWGIQGFEYDDLAAHCVSKYRGRFKMIYAATNDSDLFQLLDAPNFAIYSKGITDVMTGTKLWKTMGVTPQQYMTMTALTGTHNDIAGIEGVGPVTAKKALLDPSLMRMHRSKHGALIDRNLELIKLPHHLFPRSTQLPEQLRGFDRRALYKFLGKYDIDTTHAMVQAFEQLNHEN